MNGDAGLYCDGRGEGKVDMHRCEDSGRSDGRMFPSDCFYFLNRKKERGHLLRELMGKLLEV